MYKETITAAFQWHTALMLIKAARLASLVSKYNKNLLKPDECKLWHEFPAAFRNTKMPAEDLWGIRRLSFIRFEPLSTVLWKEQYTPLYKTLLFIS